MYCLWIIYRKKVIFIKTIKKWESRKEDIIDRYINKNETPNEIAEIYNCETQAILRYLHIWNVKVLSKNDRAKIIWNERKEDIISRYLNGESTESIAKSYNCYGSTIANYLHEWDIELRKERYNNLYNIDIEYFNNINTEEKAYWIGFLLADGHISPRGIMMAVQKNDIDILEKFF